MSIRLILAATAAVAIAGPALAQDAPAAPPAEAAQTSRDDVDPAEAALDAKGEAFGQRMEAMSAEMQAAATAEGADEAKVSADLDAIVARYQPEADAFAAEVQHAFEAKAAASTDETEKTQLAANATQVVAVIKGVPAMVRGQVVTAVAGAAAATSSAEPTPATPQ